MRYNKKNINNLEISLLTNLLNVAEEDETRYKREISDIITLIKPEDFTNKQSKTLYSEMIKALEKGNVPDVDTIFQAHDMDIDVFINTKDLIYERPLDFATALLERKNKKSLKNISDYINKNLDMPTKKILENISEKITQISMKRRKKILDYKAIATEFKEKVVNSKTPDGFSTGYSKIDDHIIGLKPGELIVIGARPSEGKTTLAINIMKNLVFRKKNCLFFSYEMNASEIFKILTNVSTNPPKQLHKIRDNVKTKEYQETIKKLETYNNFINFRDIDEENHTIDDLKAETRMLHAQKKLDCVFVDYLQLVKASGSYDQRRLEIGAISRKLKLFAKELEIPIVLLSQLNRATETRNDKKPAMSDLKESGDIEQDANTILLIWDEVQEEGNPEIKLLIKKARGGMRGEIKLKFYKPTGKFYND